MSQFYSMIFTVVFTWCYNCYCLCLIGSIDCVDESVSVNLLIQTEALELDTDSLPKQPSTSRSTLINPHATTDEVTTVTSPTTTSDDSDETLICSEKLFTRSSDCDFKQH